MQKKLTNKQRKKYKNKLKSREKRRKCAVYSCWKQE